MVREVWTVKNYVGVPFVFFVGRDGIFSREMNYLY